MKSICEFTNEDDYCRADILLSRKHKVYIVQRFDAKGKFLDDVAYGWYHDHDQQKAFLDAINHAQRHVPRDEGKDSA